MQLNHLQRGDGEAVVLIHGLFGSAANLGIIARALAEHFTTFSLDARNHGQSPHSEDMGYADMAADVIEFMDAQQIDQCSVVGHSMGGKIAMQVALDHPQRVKKLVVADVAPVDYPPHHHDTLSALAAVAEQTIHSRAQADDILARHLPEAGVRAFLLKSLQRGDDGEFRWILNRQGIERNYRQLGGANRGDPHAGEVLFLKGGDSNYIMPEHEPAVRQLFPNARLKVIDGAGHWLHAEKPALFNKLVLRFLLG